MEGDIANSLIDWLQFFGAVGELRPNSFSSGSDQ